MDSSWLPKGERFIEDLHPGDRVCMDVGTCIVLEYPKAGRYGVTVLLESPYGQYFSLTYRPGSPFLLEEN